MMRPARVQAPAEHGAERPVVVAAAMTEELAPLRARAGCHGTIWVGSSTL